MNKLNNIRMVAALGRLGASLGASSGLVQEGLQAQLGGSPCRGLETQHITNQEIMSLSCMTRTKVSNRWKFYDAEKDGPTHTVVSVLPVSRFEAFEVFCRYMAKLKRPEPFKKEIEIPYGR